MQRHCSKLRFQLQNLCWTLSKSRGEGGAARRHDRVLSRGNQICDDGSHRDETHDLCNVYLNRGLCRVEQNERQSQSQTCPM